MFLGTASYLLSATAFLVLTVLLSISWRGRTLGVLCILASLASTVWAAVAALEVQSERVPHQLMYVSELLRDGTWLAVLVALTRPILARWVRAAIAALWGALLLLGILLPVLAGADADLNQSLLLQSRSGLAMALTALVLIEHAYRGANPAARRALKYFVFGVGGVFAYDLFLYSQAELLRVISLDAWYARGVVNALLVPLIAVSVRRNPEWSLDIFVSRHVIFYSGALLLVGGYLLLMALGGYYVREVGGTWGAVAQVAFLVGSGLLLAVMVLSGTLRARAKVFLSKHFYRNKYDYRIEWLRFIQTLSSTSEGDVGRAAVRAVAQILTSPGGVLFTIDESSRRFVPVATWPGRLGSYQRLEEMRSEDALVRLLSGRQWIIDLAEYRQSPDVYDNIELPAWVEANPALRLISPLLVLDRLVGFIALADPSSSFRLTYEDRELLKTVGRHVATQIAQHEADQRLAEGRQFEAYNRLTAFMMHDLKNSVAQLKLLVENAERHKRNPAFIDDAISTIANTVERMTRLTEQLKERMVTGSMRAADLNELTRIAVERCKARRPMPALVADSQPAIVRADPDRLTSVLEHVIRNAQDATPELGSIEVRLRRNGQEAVIQVADKGCGMDPEFVREELFRPFATTKGSGGMGIGAYQTREYVRMLGGEVEVQSSPGRGTTFSISLPLAAAATTD